MAPVRGSMVWVVNAGCEARRRAILEDRERARLAPSERGDCEIGPAVAVEVGGLDIGDARPAVEPEGAELALAEAAQPDDGAVAVIGRKELAEIGDEQILDAVESTSVSMRCEGCGRLATTESALPAFAGWPVNTSPCRMSVPRTSSRLSPSKSTRRTCETAGVPGMSGMVSAAARELERATPRASGHDSGGGRRSGARLM